MKTLLFSFAAAALTACLATSAFAEPTTTSRTTLSVHTGNATVAIKSARPGPRIKSGRIYHVRDYRAWSSYCWFPQYRCYGYYSSIDGLWFYWYAPLNRFLPVSYMAQYPPAVIGIGPGSPIAGSPGLPGILPPGTGPTASLPPGATGVPTTPPGGAAPTPGPTAPGDPMTPPPQ